MNNDALIQHFAQRAHSFNNNGWANNEEILLSIANCASEYCPMAKDVLDYGAGTGEVSKYLLNTLSSVVQITALDISSEMLSRIKDNRISCIESSVEKTPFADSSFDLIVSRQCLHYVCKLTETLTEAKRILRKHGKFILTQFVPLEDESKPYWEKLTRIKQPLRVNFFSEKDWIKCFEENGFSVLNVQRFVTSYSVNRVIKQYQMENRRQKIEYIEAFLSAPNSYKRKYSIEVNENDIKGKSFGVTIVFDSE